MCGCGSVGVCGCGMREASGRATASRRAAGQRVSAKRGRATASRRAAGEKGKAESGENEKETVLFSAFSFPFSAFVMSAAFAQFQHFSISGVGIGGAETERESVKLTTCTWVGWKRSLVLMC